MENRKMYLLKRFNPATLFEYSLLMYHYSYKLLIDYKLIVYK